MDRGLIALVAFLILGLFALAMFAVFAMIFRRQTSSETIRDVLGTNMATADIEYLFDTQKVDPSDTATLSKLGRRIAKLRSMGPAANELSEEAWVEALLAAAETRRLRTWTLAFGLMTLIATAVSLVAIARTV